MQASEADQCKNQANLQLLKHCESAKERAHELPALSVLVK